jgi:hypothetical protein
MTNMLTHSKPINRSYAKQSRAVRLEDLHRRSRETLEGICNWLGLDWDDRLLESTFNGVPHVEPSNGRTIEGFQTETIARKKYDCYRAIDRFRLSVILFHINRSWNYETSLVHRLALTRAVLPTLMLIPFRIERLVWKRDLKSFSFEKAGQLIDLYIRLRREIMDLWRKDRDSDSGFLKVIEPKTPGLQ